MEQNIIASKNGQPSLIIIYSQIPDILFQIILKSMPFEENLCRFTRNEDEFKTSMSF